MTDGERQDTTPCPELGEDAAAVVRVRDQQSNRAPADADRVADACAFIRDTVKQADAGLLAIGNYLLDQFFDGDPATYAARARKNASLRALLKHAGTVDVPISKTGLSNALGLAGLRRQLGEDSAFSRLPQSLAIELLPLRDPQHIERLATDVLSWPGFTVRNLRDAVRAMKPNTGSGRRRKPRLVEAVEALARALGDGPNGQLELGADDVAALSPEQRESTRIALGYVRDRVAALREMLGAVPEPSSDVGTVRSGGTDADRDDEEGTERRARLAVLTASV